MKLSRDHISINEGGYVCGFTWVRGVIFDAWFKLPIKGAVSHRFTRFPK